MVLILGSLASDTVSRRRFQKGSVFMNRTKTHWLCSFSEYVLNAQGVEIRARRQIVLSPVKEGGRTVNLQAGRLIGSEIAAALAEQNADYSDCLTTINEKGSGVAISQAFVIA